MKRFALASLFLAAFVQSSFGAYDAFLKIGGPGGNSKQIELQSFSNASISATELNNQALTPGHRKWAPFVITRKTDSASPNLFEGLGSMPQTITIYGYQIGGSSGKGKLLFTVQLTGVVFSHAATNNAIHIENAQFTFQKITWTWTKGGVVATDDWDAPSS